MRRKIPLRFTTVVCTTFLLNTLSAQHINRATLINSDKGLSQNSVYTITKDSKGFIWIGTGDGLNRYDGKEFLIFRNLLNDKNSLDGFTISSQILEDENRRLWLSTERNLVCFDPSTRQFQSIIPFDTPSYLGNKFLISLDTAKNLIWFLTAGKCIFSFNYSKRIYQQFDFPIAQKSNNSFLDPRGIDDGKGNIWVTAYDGLYRFNKIDNTWTHEIQGRKFMKGCLSRNGTIWLLNHDSVFNFNPSRSALSPMSSLAKKSGSFYCMAIDDSDNTWIGALDGNLYKGDSKNNRLEYVGNIPALTGDENANELHCIKYDPAGLLWIGTEGGGVVKFDVDSKKFRVFPSMGSKVKAIYTKSLYSDNDSIVWIGTFKNWIYLFNLKTGNLSPLPLPVNKFIQEPTGVVYSIQRDKDGIYWIGYNGMLIAYNQKEQKFYFHSIPLGTNMTFSLINQIRVEKECLMLATSTGLYRVVTGSLGKEASFERFYTSATSESIRTRDGAVWVSSQYDGLLKISKKGKVEKQIASGTGVRCILEEPGRGLIWAASQSGLLVYHIPTDSYRIYDQSNGLINPYLYGIIKTSDQVWVSSNRGIAKGNIFFKDGAIFPEIHFKCYTKEIGLQSDEFNTGAYCSMPDGTIIFGGIKGINWFQPHEITANLHRPTVAITGLKINDRMYTATPSIEYLHSIEKTHNENTFLIKFAGMEFHNPENISYRFMLEGLDTKWTQEKSAREVRYANLPPGKFTFRLYALNADGVLSNETTLAIRILPPFYKTWWFVTLMLLTGVSVVVITTKYISQVKLKNRIRALEKEKAIEAERHRISKEMHDDLGAGLTQISLISEAAKRRNNKGAFPQRELNDIADTSKLLIENVSEIIWALNPDFDSLSGLIAYLREQIGKLLEYSNKEFCLKIPDSFNDQPLSNITRKNIIMLVKEAVNNAIKHSDASSVCVEIKLPGEHLDITVCDNGKGFAASQVKDGNGLKNYKYRTGLLGGASAIQSDENGTRVQFYIPVK